MVHAHLPGIIPFLVSMTLLLSSCATVPPAGPAGPAPDVRLGPMLALLQFETSSDHIHALLDSQGYAHVFVAAASSREVYHVVVSPDGTLQREPVASDTSPTNISAAFDSNGTLHLLLDDRHYVREGTSWVTTHDTPWEAAGIRMHRPRFVQGSKGLVWTFLVEGKEVGAQGRWDWYGFGGYGAGIIFPWHAASQKLVMVPEAAMAAPIWYVLDPHDNLDTFNSMLAADGNGNLHIVYEAFRSGLGASGQPRYAQIQLMPPLPKAEHGLPDSSANNKKLYPVTGSQIPFLENGQSNLNQAATAVDADTGTVLLVRAHDASLVLTHGKWRLPQRLPISTFWEPRLSPAGGEAFHAMTIGQAASDDRWGAATGVLYLLYAQGSWSAPVGLGQARAASTWGSIWDALAIASNGHNRAFVAWPTKTEIVGRWVEGTTEYTAEPVGGSADHPGDQLVIPDDLLEFANGKAELVTPGWASGFDAAMAAGGNNYLTKGLHDSGEWETLARVILNDKYGDNLGWYYLGMAAEGMALCDTAVHYYKISKERSERFITRCLYPACAGIKLPDALDARFSAVEAMRAAGKCAVAPDMYP